MRCFRPTLKDLRAGEWLVDSGEQSQDSERLQERLTWAAASAELLPHWGKPAQSSGMCYSGTSEQQEASVKSADFGELPEQHSDQDGEQSMPRHQEGF